MHTSEQLSESYETIYLAKELYASFEEIRLTGRNYILTHQRRYITELVGQVNSARAQLEVLELRSDQQSTQLLEQVKESFEILVAVLPPLDLEGDDLLALLERSEAIDATFDELLSEYEELHRRQMRELQARQEHLIALDRRTTIIGPFIIVILSVIAGTYGVIRLNRYKRQQVHDQAQLQIAHDWFAAVVTGSNLGTWEWDITTGDIKINEQLAQILGYAYEELTPISFEKVRDLTNWDDFEALNKLLGRIIDGEGSSYSYDTRMRHKDGHWVWGLIRGWVVKRNDEGRPISMLGTYADITERVETAQKVLSQEEESRKLFAAMTQGFSYSKIITDEQGNPIDYVVLRLNKNFETQTGIKAEQLLNRRITEALEGVEDVWIKNNGRVALSGKPMIFEAHNSYLNRYYRISSYSPQVGYFANIIEDITEEHALRVQLDTERTLFETTLINIADGIITIDAEGLVQFMNGPAETLTGWDNQEAKGRPLKEIFKTINAQTGGPQSTPFDDVVDKRETTQAPENTILVARDGVERYVSGKSTPILSTEDELLGIVIIVRDITEERQQQQEILNLSYIDPLTTLYNRRFYDGRKVLLDSEQYYPLALILADVNGLKLTNDAFGHDSGDELLRSVAATFKNDCPSSGVACRIGGDEFVILIPNCDEEMAHKITVGLLNNLKDKRVQEIPVSVSFGHAIKEDHSLPFEMLFKHAEDVMYQNKMVINLRYKKAVITTLVDRLFSRNEALKQHCETVANYCAELARVAGMPRDEIAQIRMAGLYHDLGRIAIDDAILTKDPQELTKSEQIEIRRHTEIGYNILSSVPENALIARTVLHHHERWDGRGYPQGLKGSAIPRSAQILGLVNLYVDEVEKNNGDLELSISFLEANSGILFDASLVSLFVEGVLKTPS